MWLRSRIVRSETLPHSSRVLRAITWRRPSRELRFFCPLSFLRLARLDVGEAGLSRDLIGTMAREVRDGALVLRPLLALAGNHEERPRFTGRSLPRSSLAPPPKIDLLSAVSVLNLWRLVLRPRPPSTANSIGLTSPPAPSRRNWTPCTSTDGK